MAKAKTGALAVTIQNPTLVFKWVVLFTFPRLQQENPQGAKEGEGSAGRNNKGDPMTEPAAAGMEQRQTSEQGLLGHSRQPHAELDSDVSDDTDQELDIEDDVFTGTAQF